MSQFAKYTLDEKFLKIAKEACNQFKKIEKSKILHIILDASNIAKHKTKKTYDKKNLQSCIQYFKR